MADPKQMPELDMHQKLLALRQARGWSIRDMVPILKSADPSGVGKAAYTISRYELAPNHPKSLECSREVTRMFAEIYNVDPGWLLFSDPNNSSNSDDELPMLLNSLDPEFKSSVIELIKAHLLSKFNLDNADNGTKENSS